MFCFSDSDAGLRKSDLIGWYLKEIEAEIESEEELLERKTIVEKVIDRLIHVVRFLFFSLLLENILAFSLFRIQFRTV
jgi:hypothetical protein